MSGTLSLFLGEETSGIIPPFEARIINYHLLISSKKCLETEGNILCAGAQIRTYILPHISVSGNFLPRTCREGYFPAPVIPANKILRQAHARQ